MCELFLSTSIHMRVQGAGVTQYSIQVETQKDTITGEKIVQCKYKDPKLRENAVVSNVEVHVVCNDGKKMRAKHESKNDSVKARSEESNGERKKNEAKRDKTR